MPNDLTDSLTRTDYRQTIDHIADVVEEQVRTEGRPVAEAIWEELDNSSWVIYHTQSLKALEFCNDGPGEWKHLVADDAGWRRVISVMAYSAMEADVYDELRRRDVLDDLHGRER